MTTPTDSDDSSITTLHLAYAEASVVLLESLLRLMIERGLLSVESVIEILEDTVHAKRMLAEEGTHAEISTVAAGVLSTLANSIAAANPPREPGAN